MTTTFAPPRLRDIVSHVPPWGLGAWYLSDRTRMARTRGVVFPCDASWPEAQYEDIQVWQDAYGSWWYWNEYRSEYVRPVLGGTEPIALKHHNLWNGKGR